MKRPLLAIGAATVALAVLGLALASSLPDGLEHVAERLGFASRESAAATGSPFAGYQTSFFRSRWMAQASAGLLGIVLLYGFGVLFGRTLRRKK